MVEFGQVISCGKRKYYSQAAFSLVDKTGLPDPVLAIEHLTNELLNYADVAEPPVPLEMVASFQGVNKVLRTDINASGRLIPISPNAYHIEVKSTDPIGRQNFSIGHEIGHTLIPSYNDSPTVKSDKFTCECQVGNEEEYFCDVAASNILMPSVMFKEQCSQINPSVDGLLNLSEIFEASIEAIAFRLSRLLCWKCIPVVWELALKPSQKKSNKQIPLLGFEELSQPVEEYRVKYHVGSYDTMFFPADKHIAMNSKMISACLTERSYKGQCIMPTSNRDYECYVEAMVVPYRNEYGKLKQRIISLVYT